MNLGVTEPCAKSRCAFWDAGCSVEQLGLHAFGSDVSSYLLELRARLESMRDAAGPQASRGEFARRLGADV